MTEFEVDDNYITENIPIEAMTDDELLKNRITFMVRIEIKIILTR